MRLEINVTRDLNFKTFFIGFRQSKICDYQKLQNLGIKKCNENQ